MASDPAALHSLHEEQLLVPSAWLLGSTFVFHSKQPLAEYAAGSVVVHTPAIYSTGLLTAR